MHVDKFLSSIDITILSFLDKNLLTDTGITLFHILKPSIISTEGDRTLPTFSEPLNVLKLVQMSFTAKSFNCKVILVCGFHEDLIELRTTLKRLPLVQTVHRS